MYLHQVWGTYCHLHSTLWPFARLLQFLWGKMFAARHGASDNIKTTFSTWHTIAFRHCPLFRQLHTWKVCSLPLSSSYLCLWRPSHRAALRSTGYWARACQAWQLCAQMTCSNRGQCLSEQTSVSSSSERTSCCYSEPLYEASLAQEHKHVNGCLSPPQQSCLLPGGSLTLGPELHLCTSSWDLPALLYSL